MLRAMVSPSLAERRGVYGFEAIDEGLPFMPIAARRALDASGLKLSLEGWLSLSLERRRELVRAGLDETVDTKATALLVSAVPAPLQMPVREPDPASLPRDLVGILGPSRPLDEARWRAMRGLDRYALYKYAGKPEKLARAYDEIVGRPALSHLTSAGDAQMVDIGHKAVTARRAVASACIRMTSDALEAIVRGDVAKGDVIAAARVAGILAAKRTPELIPLCHPVQTTRAAIDFEPDLQRAELRVRATVDGVDRTGVEMEAMVAAAVASLTVYDMIKSVDRWATVDAVRLEAKSGGKSGELTRPPERPGP